jgi:hypothetical protein
MSVKPEIIRAALQNQPILDRIRREAREAWEAAFTAALVYPWAQVYADALEGEPLADAEAEAAPYVADVDKARAALAEEQESVAGTLADFWERKRQHPDNSEHEPSSETPRIQELRRALSEAETRAFPHTNKVSIIGYQVDALRNAPRPDCVVLERLGVGVYQPCLGEEGSPDDAD